MRIEQIYTGCLAHGAYYIESDGEAAVIDPLREVRPYIERAERDGARIKYVLETHFHADFVSGHLDLAKKSGATIIYGPTARPGFAATVADDGQILLLGRARIKVIHTPGHTLESTTYLLIDEEGKECCLFTGDTLFIGDVGRPDLAQHVIPELTEDKLAGYLFDSLRNKIMPLSDDLIVYPNHGAGSACGKMMSAERMDTLGHQKRTNYALRSNMTKEEFKKEVLSGLTSPPGYFPQNVLLNIKGYEPLDLVLDRARTPLGPDAFEACARAMEAIIIDSRSAADFAGGFVPGSVNFGLDGSFATWVGEMIPDLQQPILLITDPGKEEETMIRLARIGHDRMVAYLKGGFAAWKASGKPVEVVQRMSAAQFAGRYGSKPLIIDVRKKSEYDSEHVVGAINVPLSSINDHLDEFPANKPFILYCAGGYRSMIAASILQQRGWRDFVDVSEGYAGIRRTDVPHTAYVRATTQL
ncbi:MAG: rhodanese-like domain-containing protein [Flavobacteriales bacterium]